MKITNCQVALLEVLGFTGQTFRDAERSLFASLNEAPETKVQGLFRLMEAASDADRAAEEAADAARSLSERLLRDAESFELGASDWNALGMSTVRDLADARVQRNERAKALHTMIALVLGIEKAQAFAKVCERNMQARMAAKAESK